jgi:hypothetical protein
MQLFTLTHASNCAAINLYVYMKGFMLNLCVYICIRKEWAKNNLALVL